jgi:TolB-like protein
VFATSVMRYKRTKKPLPEIARELNVDAVIEGTLLQSGGRVRITANLLHAPTDRHLWAETYERDLGDVLVTAGPRACGRQADSVSNFARACDAGRCAGRSGGP